MWAVLVAAGSGQRMGADIPKQYLKIGGKTLLEHSLGLLDRARSVTGIVLVVAADDRYWHDLKLTASVPVITVNGGKERAYSVIAGLEALGDKCMREDWVLVHDAARVCVSPEDIDRILDHLLDHQCGGLLAVPVRDTLKLSEKGEAVSTVDRKPLWQAQTPQVFRYGLLLDALKDASDSQVVVTDESMAMERMGHRPLLIEGRADNIKITVPEDLELADFILNQKMSGKS